MSLRHDERSSRSRTQIQDAALRLFSHQGYRGTNMREIAQAAGLSLGNLYHHFPDKEAIFKTLLEQYWQQMEDPDLPLNRALASGAFPDDLEALARAVRETLEQHRDQIALIFVDVIEFEGSHIRKFYTGMATRLERFLSAEQSGRVAERLRPEVSPLSAALIASRLFMAFFTVEVVFRVPNHFGKPPEEVVTEIATILRHGMLRER
ncbi:MAG TPA: TetR/AcrR family transcriptional regulator [Thermoanaerobaculia bacterium]